MGASRIHKDTFAADFNEGAAGAEEGNFHDCAILLTVNCHHQRQLA
jgi:hypothetical protein